MRSLLLAASFPPALGGVETLLYQTNRRLADPPLVLAPVPAAADDVNIRTVRLDLAARAMYRPLWALHPSLQYVQAFAVPALRAAASGRPRAIQAGHIYLAPLAWLLARRLGLPFVVYAYGQEVWRAGRTMGRRSLDTVLRGRALAAANAVLVPGGFTAGLLADWRVPLERIVAVPYGAEPRPVVAPPTGTTLLTVARLIPRKGIDMVIRAMPGLPADVAYRVVGSGPDQTRLRELARAQGVADRVCFLGRLDDSNLADEYRRCTVFVLPARRTLDGDLEGYGLVYFEAAAWGRPVIAGRSGGEVDAVVDGQTGILVDGESPEQLSSTIAALLADRARLESLGAAGRKRVETTHNWSRAAAVVDATLAGLR
ncbi:MAG TPA: glycosyltransferase family 4 protein [Chloroflexota bacterium]|nr:glycosyltransferase family 4 protein [Chloroflexota bacterium]